MSAQLVLDETSLPSYSQVPTVEEKNSLTAPLYPELNRTLEKAMPVSVTSESSESTTFEPLYKSCIDCNYDRIARQWGFDEKKTKEENIDIIQQKVAVLEEQIDWKFPSGEEEIELEAGKKLVKILPTIVTSLMPIKMKKNPQQEESSFEDIPSTLQYHYQINNPVTPTSNFGLEILWQKAIKRFGFSKERPENNEKFAKRIWDINQSRWEYYLEQHDEFMIHAYRSELDILKMIGDKLLQVETNLFKEKSPIFKKENKSKVKLPFEDDNEFYQCAEPWGIKRNDSLQKIEGTLTVAERNTQ